MMVGKIKEKLITGFIEKSIRVVKKLNGKFSYKYKRYCGVDTSRYGPHTYGKFLFYRQVRPENGHEITEFIFPEAVCRSYKFPNLTFFREGRIVPDAKGDNWVIARDLNLKIMIYDE